MARQGPIHFSAANIDSPILLPAQDGTTIVTIAANGDLTLQTTGGKVGFYGVAPVALQTGVAVSAGGIHAALVALNLITA